MLELVAIWAIIAATLVWFVRDERRQKNARLDTQARRFATAADYRFQPRSERAAAPAAPMMIAPRPAADLAELQRRFAAELRRS